MNWLVQEAAGWLMEAGALLIGALLLWWRGRASARAKAKLREAEAYRDTRRRIDDADIAGDDPAAARRWLHERNANQR